MSEPPRHLPAVAAAAGRLDRSAALVAGLPAVFAGTAFDPADPVAGRGVAWPGRRPWCCAPGRCPSRCSGRSPGGWPPATPTGNGVINTSDWNRWVATAAGVGERPPEVCSFADLTLAEWIGRVGAGVPRRPRPAAPRPARRYRAEIALRGLLRRLAVRYSDAAVVDSTTCGACGSTRGSRAVSTSPAASTSVRWDDIRPPAGCATASSSTCTCSWNPGS